jgi:DNA-binding CsgD family transcriptional regulator
MELMYGSAFEVNQTALAMDTTEAAAILVDRSESSAFGLVQLANGWPAVIGLAGVSSAEIDEDLEQVPESLYRYFADEVFNSLGSEIRQGLTTLAVAPLLDAELASAVLGDEEAERVSVAALDVGLLVERGPHLDLHPLARAFLEERSAQLGLVPAEHAAGVCLRMYRSRREWDPAFELITRTGAIEELEDLLREALDELLDTARLPTLERWCDAAAAESLDAPIFELARAELLLRGASYVESIAHAEAAAAREQALQFRALMVGGLAAHLASREEHALALYRRSEAAAETDAEVRDARWGQLTCFIDLELPQAEEMLAELSEGVGFANARDLVRAAGHGVYFQLRSGGLDLDAADVARQLLPVVSDPNVECSFLSGYSVALALVGRYTEGLNAARELRRIAQRYRFDFAIPYALSASAMAYCGKRKWRHAEHVASLALARARRARDLHADLQSSSVLLRLYAQTGRHADALAMRIEGTRGALPASIGDIVLSRALVLACAGRTSEAAELVDEVDGTTKAVEPVVLASAVTAVCALRNGEHRVVEQAVELERVAFLTGAVDLLVTTYRACPELLSILLRSAEGRRFRELVDRVGDADLARAVGQPIAFDDRRLLLSPREFEVYELLRAGLPNREIARLLFIEQSTVKAHTHRIYDKLGVRSRSALAVQAALERPDQATSAIRSASSDEPSSSL